MLKINKIFLKIAWRKFFDVVYLQPFFMFKTEGMQKNEIILYQPDNTISLEVRLEDETVWLTQAQMAELFQKDRTVITRHINNIFKEGELEFESNVHFLHFANSDRPIGLYNLDVIISVGYRVKSKVGTNFRRWAKHNQQYPPIAIEESPRYHDRFLIIDGTVYHIGASLKDLGKKLFAFSKLEVPAEWLGV